MKIEKEEIIKEVFTPFIITITVESEEERRAIHALVACDYSVPRAVQNSFGKGYNNNLLIDFMHNLHELVR